MTRTAIAICCLLLAGCATSNQQQTAENQQSTTEPAVAAEAQPAQTDDVPELKNYTPADMFLMEAEMVKEKAGSVYNVTSSIALDFDASGRLRLSEDQWDILEDEKAEPDDLRPLRRCSKNGSPYNLQTMWFPYTGIFVSGGKLISVQTKNGKKENLLTLTKDPEDDTFLHDSKRKDHRMEYSYMPCVGTKRVKTGVRLEGYLPKGAVFTIKPDKGKSLNLHFPEPFEPWLLLRYRSGAMIPTPMRPVVITIDMEKSRMTVQYQGNFSTRPALRKIDYHLIHPGTEPSPDESPEEHRKRTDATVQELYRCAVPTRPVEPCADPDRIPDLRIFSMPQ